jgi:hypothetical protein
LRENLNKQAVIGQQQTEKLLLLNRENMKLEAGARIKLLGYSPELIVASDWLNERLPQQGDEVIVESIDTTTRGQVFRLLCEPRPGFLIWRVDILGDAFNYELVY